MASKKDDGKQDDNIMGQKLKKCTKCGKPLPMTGKTCLNCGHKN
jgi:hypothetical protein